jgi:WSC domain.
MACPGNTEVVCGGPSRLSLYGQSATAPAHTPVPVNEEVTHYVSQGCWTEAIGVRTLNGASVVSSLMTIYSCGNFCLNNGFLYFGLEYGSECWCGNMINDQSVIGEEEGAMSVLESECNMPCAGNSEEDCGAGNRLSVYRWVSDEESE